ncbi:hypothetical protein [Streptomyces sp. NPDC057284]|uniref:hypothetical protein n=1 Tax=Streptomyces sp. NPDC057284 TaxID=3346083 RepID=UPI00363B1692
MTTRYSVHAYDPHTRTVLAALDVKEDRAGVVRPFSFAERAEHQRTALDELDELRLIHRRERDDVTALHTNHCRHVIKAAFTIGGDRGVAGPRRVYRFWMQTREGHTYWFLVRAPSQPEAYALSRTWWQGTPSADGLSGGHLNDGDGIDVLTCEGARDMPVWPYPDPIADPRLTCPEVFAGVIKHSPKGLSGRHRPGGPFRVRESAADGVRKRPSRQNSSARGSSTHRGRTHLHHLRLAAALEDAADFQRFRPQHRAARGHRPSPRLPTARVWSLPCRAAPS